MGFYFQLLHYKVKIGKDLRNFHHFLIPFIKHVLMKFGEYLEKLTILKDLIAKANTGSPKDLAKRLNVSERTVRRLIDQLKNEKTSIVFCRKRNSYIEE